VKPAMTTKTKQLTAVPMPNKSAETAFIDLPIKYRCEMQIFMHPNATIEPPSSGDGEDPDLQPNKAAYLTK
jgi:hypothetical protein